MEFLGIACAASFVLASFAFVSCAQRTPAVRVPPGRVATDPAIDAIWLPLRIGSFPVGGSTWTPDVLTRPIETLRIELPEARPSPPMSAEVSTLLGRAAEAMRRSDAAQAIDLAEEARRVAPERIEPLEILLLAQLARGDRAEVRSTLGAIVALAPANAIGLAYRGLDAAQQGRPAESLGYLAHFVGSGSVAARGASIPLPTAPGELEEVAACSALRLGHAEAAFAALDQAALQRIGDEASLRRLALLRADALAMLGRTEESFRVLERLEVAQDRAGSAAPARLEDSSKQPAAADGGRGSAEVEAAGGARAANDGPAMARAAGAGGAPAVADVDPIAVLAALRLDALSSRVGRDGERLREVASRFAREPSDVMLFARLVGLAQVAPDGALRATCAESLRSEPAGVESQPANVEDDRVAVARAVVLLIRASRFASPSELHAARAELEKVLEAPSRRAMPDAWTLRTALRIVARDDLRSAATLACDLVLLAPHEVDAIARALMGAPAEPDAILAALEADGRTSASEPLRSRILARLGFAEEALLVAEGARARDSASTPVLAAAILAAAEIGDVTILAEVDEVARSGDASLAPILVRAWLDVGDEARAMDRAAGAPVGAAVPADPSVAVARRLAEGGRALLTTRLPIADECLALADEIDPFGAALDAIAQRAGTPAAPAGLPSWIRETADATPSIPGRRKLRLFLDLGEGRVARVETIPATGWAARFDARVLAVDAVGIDAAIEATRMRPQTVDARAALARRLVAAGRIAEAAEAVERFAANDSVEGNARAIGVFLGAAAEIARRDPARARTMSSVAEAVLPRLGRATSADMLAAMRLAVASRASEAQLERLAQRLVGVSRPLAERDVGGCLELLDAIRRIDDDPFPAALLADAIARDARAEVEARRRIARTAIALSAAAGGGWERTHRLIVDLADEGIPVFQRPSDRAADANPSGAGAGGVDLGRMLVRASDAHALLGDDLSSERLLREALRLPAPPAEAYNNLAFIAIDRGAIDAGVVDLAATALRLAPDNPSILDTVGVLRYRQGRVRDSKDGPGAITLFRQALRNDPENPSLETLDHLGDALWLDGDQQGAIRCWQQVAQVARLRYPPQEIARNIAEFQRGEFGVALLEPAQLIRRLYGRIVDRAERKLEEVARGEAPAIRPVDRGEAPAADAGSEG